MTAGRAVHAQSADTLDVAASVRAAVAASVEQEGNPSPRLNDALVQFYAERHWSPAWVADARPTPQASALTEFLAQVQQLGLQPEDYDAEVLRDWTGRLAGASPGLTELGNFDVSLSRSLLLLLNDLSQGRVDPASLGFSLPRRNDVDLASVARDVSRTEDVSATIRQVEPRYAGYQALERALARYEALAADSELRAPHRTRLAVRPGATYADLPALRRLLIAFGDLADDTATRDTAGPQR